MYFYRLACDWEISPVPSLSKMDEKEGDLLTDLIDSDTANPHLLSPIVTEDFQQKVALDCTND